MEFAATVVQGTSIKRVCLGIGGDTKLCFDQDTLASKQLSYQYETTQVGTVQYADSIHVIVLEHSADEESRLQELINTLVSDLNEESTEDLRLLRIIIRELLLTYCSELFYVEETNDIEQYITRLQLEGLEQSFQRDKDSKAQKILNLYFFYEEAFALALPWICQNKNIFFVNFFLEKGVGIDAVDFHEQTALCIACKNVQIESIKALLQAGANVNFPDGNGYTPLSWAVQKGRRDIVTELLSARADVNLPDSNGKTPLSWAAERGQTAIALVLLDASADVNYSDKDGDTPLYCAAAQGHTDIVKALLAVTPNINTPNKYGDTALFIAIQNNHKEIETILLNHGAEMSIAEALRLGCVESARSLLAKDVDVNIAHNGDSPLSLATEKGYTDIVKDLLLKGALVNHQDNNADTALFLAVKRNPIDIEIVRALLEAGADIDESLRQNPNFQKIMKEFNVLNFTDDYVVQQSNRELFFSQSQIQLSDGSKNNAQSPKEY